MSRSQIDGILNVSGRGGASTTVLQVSLPLMNRRYRSVLLSSTFSMVNDPNLEMPPGMYLQIC